MSPKDPKILRRLTLLLLGGSLQLVACDSGPQSVSPETVVQPPRPVAQAPPVPTPVVEPNVGAPAPEWASAPADGLGLSPAHAVVEDARRAVARGDREEAIALYRTAVEIDATYASAWEELFDLLREDGSPAEAAAACAGLLANARLYGHAAASRNLQCANTHRAAGELEMAERFARGALAESARLEPMIALSSILLELDRPAEVVSLLSGSVRAQGGDLEASALSNLGNAYLRLARVDEAVQTLESARAIAPERSDVLINLSDALQRAGREAEAQELLNQVIEREPNHPAAQQRLQQIGGG